jgi:hypothetical protein
MPWKKISAWVTGQIDHPLRQKLEFALEDFFAEEVWSIRGLITDYVLLFIHLQSRKIILGGLTLAPKLFLCLGFERAEGTTVSGNQWLGLKVQEGPEDVLGPDLLNVFPKFCRSETKILIALSFWLDHNRGCYESQIVKP